MIFTQKFRSILSVCLSVCLSFCLMANCNLRFTHSIFTIVNKEKIMDQLKLALAWNRIDVAKESILTEDAMLNVSWSLQSRTAVYVNNSYNGFYFNHRRSLSYANRLGTHHPAAHKMIASILNDRIFIVKAL